MSLVQVLLLLSGIITVIMFLLLKSTSKDLSEAKKDLEEALCDAIKRKNEIEVLRDAKEKLKENREKEAPRKKESIPSGDSTSRTKRLNSLSNQRCKN